MALIVLGGAALLTLLATPFVVAILLTRSRRGVVVEPVASGVLRIRTPIGRGQAVLGRHVDLGSVYVVTTNLRGEGHRVEFVPPAPARVLASVEQRVAALTTGSDA